MKRYTLTFLLFLLGLLKAQNFQFEPLFVSPNCYDLCTGVIETEDKLLVLNCIYNIVETPSHWVNGEIPLSQTPNSTFTTFRVFDANGNVLNDIYFPCNDTMFYYGLKMLQLPNGKIAIGGRVQYVDYLDQNKTFIAIISNDHTEIENIYYYTYGWGSDFVDLELNSSNNLFLNYIINADEYCGEVFATIDPETGQFIDSTKIDFYFYRPEYTTSIFIDNKYYRFFFDKASLSNEFIVKNKYIIDENCWQGQMDTFQINDSLLPLTIQGVSRKNGSFLLSSKNGVIYSVDSFLEFSNFYIPIDSGIDQQYFNNICFVDNNYIFSSLSYKIDSTDFGIYVYCLDSLGQLHWKQKVNLHEQGFLTNQFTDWFELFYFQYIKATTDKGCIVVVGINEADTFRDNYILKLDSTGNQTDLFTGIHNRKAQYQMVFNVFPNPTSNVISINTESNETFKIDWYTLEGKRIGSQNFKKRASFDFTNYSNQILYYTITNAQGVLVDSGELKVD